MRRVKQSMTNSINALRKHRTYSKRRTLMEILSRRYNLYIARRLGLN